MDLSNVVFFPGPFPLADGKPSGNGAAFLPLMIGEATEGVVAIFNGAGKIGLLRIQSGLTFDALAGSLGTQIITVGTERVIPLWSDGDTLPDIFKRLEKLFCEIADIEHEVLS